MWFLDQLISGNLYNIPYSFRLRGQLHISLLERRLNKIIDRHEILRTTFQMTDKHPVQIINSSTRIPLKWIDLRDIEVTRRSIEITQIISEDARRPFDLVRGPLIRFSLLQLHKEEFIFALVMHHIVSDGWSMSMMVPGNWFIATFRA